MRAVGRRLGAYLRDRRGGVAAPAVLAIMVLLSIATLGVEVSRAARDKISAQAALDSALLSTAASYLRHCDDAKSEDLARFFLADNKDSGVDQRDVALTITRPSEREIHFHAETPVRFNSPLLGVFGMADFDMTASAEVEAEIPYQEVTVVFDVSGSMRGHKIQAAQDGLTAFVDGVLGVGPCIRNFMILNFVPFNNGVRLENYAEYFLPYMADYGGVDDWTYSWSDSPRPNACGASRPPCREAELREGRFPGSGETKRFECKGYDEFWPDDAPARSPWPEAQGCAWPQKGYRHVYEPVQKSRDVGGGVTEYWVEYEFYGSVEPSWNTCIRLETEIDEERELIVSADEWPLDGSDSLLKKLEIFTEGGSGSCPDDALLADIDDASELQRAFTANGWTSSDYGFSYAYKLNTPEWAPAFDKRTFGAPSSRDVNSVIIFMSDGVPVRGKRETGDNGDVGDALSDACANAKGDGVVVYTIGYEMPESGRQLLRDCASEGDKAINADSDSIELVFRGIATNILNDWVRIAQ